MISAFMIILYSVVTVFIALLVTLTVVLSKQHKKLKKLDNTKTTTLSTSLESAQAEKNIAKVKTTSQVASKTTISNTSTQKIAKKEVSTQIKNGTYNINYTVIYADGTTKNEIGSFNTNNIEVFTSELDNMTQIFTKKEERIKNVIISTKIEGKQYDDEVFNFENDGLKKLSKKLQKVKSQAEQADKVSCVAS